MTIDTSTNIRVVALGVRAQVRPRYRRLAHKSRSVRGLDHVVEALGVLRASRAERRPSAVNLSRGGGGVPCALGAAGCGPPASFACADDEGAEDASHAHARRVHGRPRGPCRGPRRALPGHRGGPISRVCQATFESGRVVTGGVRHAGLAPGWHVGSAAVRHEMGRSTRRPRWPLG